MAYFKANPEAVGKTLTAKADLRAQTSPNDNIMVGSAIHDTASFTTLHVKSFKVTTFKKTCNTTSYQR